MFLQQITGRNNSMRNYEEGSSSQAPQQYPREQQQEPEPPYQLQEDPRLRGPVQVMQQPQERLYQQNEIVIIDDDDEEEEEEEEDQEEVEDEDVEMIQAGETSHQSPVEEESSEDEEMNPADDDEYIEVDLSSVEEHLTCPICLDIIRQTRTVMECLHRFCKECIDKAMRLCKHECPACRGHVASRRSLREDHVFDDIIAELYPNRDEPANENMELNEEEKALNEQIQASFAKTLHRQNEALPRRLTIPTIAVSNSRRRGGGRRGRKRNHNTHHVVSDNDEDSNLNGGGRESISSDHLRSPPDSGRALVIHVANIQDDAVVNREKAGPSPTTDLVRIGEMPRWGRGGQRSQIRRDSGSSSRNGLGNRMSRLMNHLNHMQIEGEGDNEWDICVALITLDEHTLPSLDYPYISCSPDFSIKQLREFIAAQTNVQLKEVELLALTNPSFESSGSAPVYNPSKGALKLLKARDTVEGQLSYCTTGGVLVLGYRHKFSRQ